MLKLASFLLTYAAFALLQSVARNQPLAVHLAQTKPQRLAVQRRWRGGARALAAVIFVLAWLLLSPAFGGPTSAEASLVWLLHLALVASGFVALAGVLPRLAWALAIAAPVLALPLALAARWWP